MLGDVFMMSDKDLDAYQKGLMKSAKGNIGLGIIGGIGTAGFARVGAANPAVAPTSNMVVSGLRMTQVGGIAQAGMAVVPPMKGVPKRDGSGRGVRANYNRGGCKDSDVKADKYIGRIL